MKSGVRAEGERRRNGVRDAGMGGKSGMNGNRRRMKGGDKGVKGERGERQPEEVSGAK